MEVTGSWSIQRVTWANLLRSCGVLFRGILYHEPYNDVYGVFYPIHPLRGSLPEYLLMSKVKEAPNLRWRRS